MGESEKIITAIFTLAEKYEPCIIFIDEIDSVLGKRTETDHEVTTRMKSLWMQLWDGIISANNKRILVIGATNKPFNLDDAILRRLNLQFEIPLPNTQQRKNILSIVIFLFLFIIYFKFIYLLFRF